MVIFGPMELWHSIVRNDLRIVSCNGVWYAQYWDAIEMDWELHEWIFVDQDIMFSYIDWCDLYCDRVLHNLLIRDY